MQHKSQEELDQLIRDAQQELAQRRLRLTLSELERLCRSAFHAVKSRNAEHLAHVNQQLAVIGVRVVVAEDQVFVESNPLRESEE